MKQYNNITAKYEHILSSSEKADFFFARAHKIAQKLFYYMPEILETTLKYQILI